MTKHSDVDVAIVGGGPAGLAAGICFASNGLSTIVLEKKEWPVDKTCGEGILPIGVRELAKLGVLALLKKQCHPFNGIEMISIRQKRVNADFVDGSGLGVRRTVLSAALFERATEEKHLVLSPKTLVKSFGRDSNRIVVQSNQGPIRCRFLVGADGLRSPLRTRLNLDYAQSPMRRYGANQHFKVAPWTPFVEVHFSDGLEAYVTPCSEESIGVAFLWNYDRFSPQLGSRFLVDQCLERFPALHTRLKGCTTTSAVQATGPFRQKVSDTIANNVALLGDAAGYFDAITGNGISIALSEARMLVEHVAPLLLAKKAIITSDLHSFARDQKRLRFRSNLTTQLSLWTARHPSIQLPVFALLSKYPLLFQRFLAF